MDFEQELVKQGASVAAQVIKNSAQGIHTKITAAKSSRTKDEAIGELQEIINELIDERSQLVQITQAFEEKMSMGKMSDDDIDYITKEIVPLLEKLMESSEGDYSKNLEALETFKPILSKETFNILQLLGFNFKEALGKPLTDLANKAIKSNTPISTETNVEYNILAKRVELELLDLSKDEEAYSRYIKLIGRE